MSSGPLSLPDRPGGTAPHVIVESVVDPVMNSDDLHHLANVRRVRDGDLVSATDGHGSWRWCSFESDHLRPVGDVVSVERPHPVLTVGFALVKGSKPELVVQKLTEIGIDVIVPFVAERSVVRWDDAKVARQAERLTKVAREASMQSRRIWIPRLAPVATFAELGREEGVVRADRDGSVLGSEHLFVLIGPEGGWSDAESGVLPSVRLGSNVLRSETAAIVAASQMVAIRDREMG